MLEFDFLFCLFEREGGREGRGEGKEGGREGGREEGGRGGRKEGEEVGIVIDMCVFNSVRCGCVCVQT